MGSRPASEVDAGAGTLAQLVGVSKRFGPLRAVDDVSFEVRAGEVHALFGENGAGKTTAVKILAGLLQPDAGTVVVAGKPLRLRNRKDGARAGIGFVQQHFSLVEELTCADNLLLGHPSGGAVIDRRAAAARLLQLSERFRLHVRPDARVADLSMGERQRLEILIAVSWGVSVLILDEPTANLGVAEFDALKAVVSSLTVAGVGVIFITHKLPEILALADRVTVMRQGRVVWQGAVEGADPEALAVAMIGELPASLAGGAAAAPGEAAHPIIRLRGASLQGRTGAHSLHGIDLEIYPHEVVGVAGVAGNGQRELALMLAGVANPDNGQVETTGARIAYIPEDRALDALALDLPVSRNAILRAHRRLATARFRWLRSHTVRDFTRRILASFGVQPARPEATTATLSGGNQQKLVLGRELAEASELIVAHNPTRGLDVRTSAEVRRRLLEARGGGAGVVLITPDLDELAELSDRVLVLYHGRIIGSLKRHEISASRLGRLMAGVT